MKLEKAITFKISKLEAEFIDYGIKRYKEHNKMDVSKSNFIRYSINMWRENILYKNSIEYQWATWSFMGDAFNIENIKKIKKGRRSKEDRTSNLETYMPVNIPIRVMLSQEDRDFIDNQVIFLKKSCNINVSRGDLIRFCIHCITKISGVENIYPELNGVKNNKYKYI